MSLGQLPLDCPCFLRSNIYIDQIRTDNGAITIRKHFTFDDEAVFRRKEWALLRTLPAATSDALIAAICEEIARREAMDRVSQMRKRAIARLGWVPKVPSLLTAHGGLRAPLLVPSFAALVDAATSGALVMNCVRRVVCRNLDAAHTWMLMF